MALITKCLKKGKIHWEWETELNFVVFDEKNYIAPVLAFSNLNESFYVEYDVHGVGTGSSLSQEKCSVAYFCKKLSESQRKWSNYE